MVAKSVQEAVESIRKYLESKSYTKPIFVNVNNSIDYITVKESLNSLLRTKGISDYCPDTDGLPDLSTLFHECRNTTDKILLLGFSHHLKLMGTDFLNSHLKILNDIFIQSGKLVVLCVQMSDIFRDMIKNDIRLRDRIILVDNKQVDSYKITFITACHKFSELSNAFKGYSIYLKKFELDCINHALVLSQLAYGDLSSALIEVSVVDNPFKMIQLSGINESHVLKCEYGTEEQWAYLLSQIDGTISSLSQLFINHFGDLNKLADNFYQWRNWGKHTKWLLYIALKVSGTQNAYLSFVLNKTEGYEDFIKQIFCAILEFDYNENNFIEKYSQRKNVVKYIDSLDDSSLFCKLSKVKGINRLYYLTDLTDMEKQTIIECLSQYEKIDEVTEDVLQVVYPDLAKYLEDYNFGNSKFETYFKQYKRQKINNKIYNGFIELVNENARTREYNLILPTRGEIFEKIDKNDAKIYFIDALGVEYLSYICELCRDMGMNLKIYLTKANIPTTTYANKDFLDGCEYVDIKDLDKIKHSGEKDYNYKLNKLPLHLPKELEIIKGIFEKIKSSLTYKSKAIVVSDHGASRLVVINEKQYSYSVESNGTQGGRCCKYNESMPEIDFATVENGQYVLANYDRFKVQGAPRVETHGGATLEEVMIPVIEIRNGNENIVAKLMDDIIYVSYKKKAELKIFISEKVEKISVKINDKYYNSTEQKEQFFVIPAHDIKQVRDYKAEVFVGDNFVGFIEFKVQKESGKTSDLGI